MGNWLRRLLSRNQQVMQEQTENMEDQSQEIHSGTFSFQHEPMKKVVIKMKESASRKYKEQLSHNKSFSHLLECQTWFIDFRQEGVDYPQFMSIIQECQGVRTLKIIGSSLYRPWQYIFNEISFIDLQKLTLSDCLLQSVQFIHYLNMPNLKELNLNRNNLTCLRSLRKLTSKIQYINVRENKIRSLNDDQIWKMTFANQIEGLNFEEDKQFYGDNYDWVFKLPCETIVRLELNSRFRIVTKGYKLNKIKLRYKGKLGIFCWGPRTNKY